MRKDNTQNYQTSNTRIYHFNDFTSNIGSEKSELDKMKRSRLKNEPEGDTNLANVHMSKYNKVTNKYDVLSNDEVIDKIDAIEQDGYKEPKRKFKIKDDALNPNHFFTNVTDVKEDMKHLSSFEAYTSNFGTRQDQGHETNEVMPKPDIMGSEHEISNEQDYEGEDYEMEEDKIEHHHEGDETTSYMFFNNLQSINTMTDEIYKMDHETVDKVLSEGHNWAEDHISTAKEMIGHVYNFVKNESVTEELDVDIDVDTEQEIEESEPSNYMFFANLETINTQTTELLQMDKHQIDEMLTGGHDWAEDHMAAAKENIQQVYEFLKSELN